MNAGTPKSKKCSDIFLVSSLPPPSLVDARLFPAATAIRGSANGRARFLCHVTPHAHGLTLVGLLIICSSYWPASWRPRATSTGVRDPPKIHKRRRRRRLSPTYFKVSYMKLESEENVETQKRTEGGVCELNYQ